MKTNLILNTDSYKASMFVQYPPNTTSVYSYVESRGGKYGETVFFGLQAFIKEYLLNPITQQDIDEAEEIWTAHGEPFNKEGWQYILDNHNGFMPVRIKAVPEGTVVPTHNVLVTIENTDPKCFWLTTYLETSLLRAIWFPTTVATNSHEIKKIIAKYLTETGGSLDGLPFKLHDFSKRGVSSYESSMIGGMAHLVSFMGTDTISAVVGMKKYYNSTAVAGFSIPASEHSISTSWGPHNEETYASHMIDTFSKDHNVVAMVSDTYNLFNFLDILGTTLNDKITNLGKNNKTLVVRPDCYDSETEIYTENGWIKFENLTDEKVAQVSDTGALSFVKPIKKVAQHYSGKMFHFTSIKGTLDAMVTPDHRMVWSNKSGKMSVTAANTIKMDTNKYFIRSASLNNEMGPRSLTPHERLLIAFQADGSYPSGGYSDGDKCADYITLRWNFAKKRKADRLINIAEQCQYEFSVHREPSRIENYNIYVRVPRNTIISKTFDWVNANTKSAKWCQEFIEEVSHWDATRRSDFRYKFDTTVKEVCDVVFDVATLAGYGCKKAINVDNRSEKFSDVHTLHIRTANNTINGQSVIKTEIDYDGMVYCVTVPSGMILIRRNGATLVSGNSGDPCVIPVQTIEKLMQHFGYTVNDKGYKLLPSYIRVIQGDGVNVQSIETILSNMKEKGICADNIAFGMGGAMTQIVNRDDQKFAMKASAVCIDGKWVDIFKDPITDHGKKSKKGKLALVKTDGKYTTVSEEYADINGMETLLQTVYNNGKLYNETTLSQVRDRVNK